jgi:hypothetical protein
MSSPLEATGTAIARSHAPKVISAKAEVVAKAAAAATAIRVFFISLASLFVF